MTEQVEFSAVDWLILALVTFMACLAAVHALINKRDPRAALGWVAVCLVFPLLGPVLYVLFGVNRIQTRAQRLKARHPFRVAMDSAHETVQERFAQSWTDLPEEFAPIARVADAVTSTPLLTGNLVEPLYNGEQAYPAMLEAIATSARTLFVSSYIFQTDRTGLTFVEALARARDRGVDVRVIVDGLGELYSLPGRIGDELRSRELRVTRFLPPRLLPPSLYVNLRSHRKILVADGRVAFTGGMNIDDRHLCDARPPPARASDVHFRVAGPIASQFEHAFLEDWRFCTGEGRPPESVLPWDEVEPPGSAVCRVIPEGPNEEFNTLGAIYTAAVGLARHRIAIVTPYFLPTRDMIVALQTAAMRGVSVTLVLPLRNNLVFVHWATRNVLWELIEFGVDACYQPAPFAHTKLFLVDDFYAQVGSANIDPRSLRLNFELNMEIFDRVLVRTLWLHVETLRPRSRTITPEELRERSLPVRIRDAAAWLFTPYL